MGATLGLAFLAGVLSILNPCTLPILPVILAGAASEHRLGPLALAAGLAVSFTLIGLFVIGLVCGFCALATGRLGMAISCHIGFNVTGLLLALD